MQKTVRRWPRWSSSLAVATSLAAPAASLLTGCASGDGMLPTMSVPPPSTVQSRAEAKGDGTLGDGAQPNTMIVTTRQRAYLDSLEAAGVHPSTDLLALSIGSYVCQARAAKQSDQAVRDYVTPLVRGDVRDSRMNAVAPQPSEVDALTADYIRIATQRLC
ncbi:DUF732 domain-containing protein [Mycolicibacterium moriokaense]|nr:DUF732 domain-containing protein [Mycolicibacterium moriokaense]